jgi:hypothetical protein
VSRWTVKRPRAARDPVTRLYSPSTLNWTRMPVDDAVADQAVETNQKVRVKLAEGWAVVVPWEIYRKEWLNRGGPPAHPSIVCERDDRACVFVVLPP